MRSQFLKTEVNGATIIHLVRPIKISPLLATIAKKSVLTN